MTYRSIVTCAKSTTTDRTTMQAGSLCEAEARSVNKVRRMFMDRELKAMGKLSVQCMEVK